MLCTKAGLGLGWRGSETRDGSGRDELGCLDEQIGSGRLGQAWRIGGGLELLLLGLLTAF